MAPMYGQPSLKHNAFKRRELDEEITFGLRLSTSVAMLCSIRQCYDESLIDALNYASTPYSPMPHHCAVGIVFLSVSTSDTLTFFKLLLPHRKGMSIQSDTLMCPQAQVSRAVGTNYPRSVEHKANIPQQSCHKLLSDQAVTLLTDTLAIRSH